MRVYLDLCCLKRPFDDSSQARVRLESAAVLSILSADGRDVEFIRARAQELENERNPSLARAARVNEWLATRARTEVDDTELVVRTSELIGLGFRGLDALHVASAEISRCDVFASCDDRLLSTARRRANALRVRVLNPVALAEELAHDSRDS